MEINKTAQSPGVFVVNLINIINAEKAFFAFLYWIFISHSYIPTNYK